MTEETAVKNTINEFKLVIPSSINIKKDKDDSDNIQPAGEALKQAATKLRIISGELDREIAVPALEKGKFTYEGFNEEAVDTLHYAYVILDDLAERCPQGGTINIIEAQKKTIYKAYEILEKPENFCYSIPDNVSKKSYGFKANIDLQKTKELISEIQPVLDELKQDIKKCPETTLNLIHLTPIKRQTRR